MKKIILLTLMCALSSIIFAGQKNLYQGGDFTGPPNFLTADDPVYYKDGTTPLADGCLLQGISALDLTTQEPPVTNDALSVFGYYVDTPNNVRGAYDDGRLPDGSPHPYQDGNAGSVGNVNGLGGTQSTDGNFKFGVGGANNNLGWLRAFSNNHWTNSVYYADGTQYAMPGSADYGPAEIGNVNLINPAYTITYTSNPAVGGDTTKIVGTVANIGAGNNQIPNNFLEVVYSGPANGDGAVATDGTFEVTPGVAGSYDVYVKVKDDNTPRNGFPISASFVVNPITPEPGIIGLIALGALAFFRKK